MKRRLAASAAFMSALALVLSGCSGGARSSSGGASAELGDGSIYHEAASKGGTVNLLANYDVPYLDPTRTYGAGFYSLMFRTLMAVAPGDSDSPTDIVPDLAAEPGTPSEDLKTWTFKLKDGMKFDTGQPITSKELKFGISRAWDPTIGIGSPYAKQLIDAPDAYKGPYASGTMPDSAIETPDAHTIVFHLKEPNAEFNAAAGQANFVAFPVGTGEGNEFISKAIASGPYKLGEFIPQSKIELVRNDQWDQSTDDIRTALPDKFVWTLNLDGKSIQERLLAGQGKDVNSIGRISKESLARVTSDQELSKRLVSQQGTCLGFLALNTQQKPTNNVKVRQAIAYAVDRKAMQVANGGALLDRIENTIIVKSVAGHVDYDMYPAPNPEKAKELLKEAGYPNGVSLTMDISEVENVSGTAAQALQQALQKAGINVTINQMDSNVYWETISTPKKTHNIIQDGWCPDWPSSPSTVIGTLLDGTKITETGNINRAQFNDPEVNAEIARIRTITDQDEANKAWGELDQKIMEQAPIVPTNGGRYPYLPGTNLTHLYWTPLESTVPDLRIMGVKDPSKG